MFSISNFSIFHIYKLNSPFSEIVWSFTLSPIAKLIYSSQSLIVKEGTFSVIIVNISVFSPPLLSNTLNSTVVCSVKINSIFSPVKLSSFIVQKNSKLSPSLSKVVLPSIMMALSLGTFHSLLPKFIPSGIRIAGLGGALSISISIVVEFTPFWSSVTDSVTAYVPGKSNWCSGFWESEFVPSPKSQFHCSISPSSSYDKSLNWNDTNVSPVSGLTSKLTIGNLFMTSIEMSHSILGWYYQL